MIIAICLLVISGIAKAFMDLSADGKLSANLNKVNTWRNKWKHGDPNLGERFFGSSTFLVGLTDFWHGMQLIFLNALIIGTILFSQSANFIWSVAVVSIVPRVTFEIFYRYVRL